MLKSIEILISSQLHFQIKTDGGLNASASFVAKANPLNRAPHKRKSELHHALCNMLSSILGTLVDGGKGQWPPSGVEPTLLLWYEAVARIRIQLMHWMDKQSKHIAVSILKAISRFPHYCNIYGFLFYYFKHRKHSHILPDKFYEYFFLLLIECCFNNSSYFYF